MPRGQALVEYVAIVATQAGQFFAATARNLGRFIITPPGMVIGGLVVVFLAFSLGWRRPPRM